MRVREVRVLRGPNFWSVRKHKLIQVLLDLEELEYQPTNKIPGFYEQLRQLLPSLHEHECSEGHAGGFFQRVKEGTWMGHVIEHIAIELQRLAGMEDLGFGRTRGAGNEGWYYVVFSYEEEKAGLYAAEAAVRIAEAIIKGDAYDTAKDVHEIHCLWHSGKLGPTTEAIVREAQSRDIPYLRLDEGSLVQLGYGSGQKRIEAAISSSTSSIAVDIVGDKHRTKRLLEEANIPVAPGGVAGTWEEAKQIISEIGFPVVLKPLCGNHGRGATVNVDNWHCAATAMARAGKHSERVIVEKHVHGNDFRALVINNRFVAAALRKPACITGNGRSTIAELVEQVNSDPRRGHCHEKPLTTIKIDEVTLELLQKKNYDLDTVLALGEELALKPTANISTGGTATDITGQVHASNILLFERIARLTGLDICGIDLMAPNLSAPVRENGGVVLEVNAAPGFRMHLQPTVGQPRNVAKPVVDMLFKKDGRIPIIAITGTNGKTTTSRLIGCMARQAGYVTGLTTTEGVYINEELVLEGDCSGPASAQFVLKDPGVEFAVLETARGGILRSGLGFDRCDGAVVTNIAADHLGLDGINDLEQLAKVKSVVPETVHPAGYAVLNADDDLVYAMKERVQCKVALFSMYADNIRIEEHCSKGGVAAVYENGYLLLRTGNHMVPVEEVANIPITFGGRAGFNIANVLAATLAAYTSRIKLSTIRETLRNFVPSHETTPGRANLFEPGDFTVMVDYAHNPHGMQALGQFIASFDAPVKVGIIAGVGDRRDEDIIALGREAARIFNEIIIRHDEDMRGRTVEEVEDLLTKGIVNVNPNIPITYSLAECEALNYAMTHAKPGSLIVVLTEKITHAVACVEEFQQRRKERVWPKAV